jgi:inosine-uridine nucleoside N-ribohydrolase
MESLAESSKRKKIWLDCDPGHDDAIAIILAGHHPSLELLGISTTAGNQTLEKTTKNALLMTSISSLESIPIIKGQEHPILKAAQICPEIHGTSGLDTKTPFPLPAITKQPIPKKAILHLSQVLLDELAAQEQITIICTGALTNIALLLLLFPETKPAIKEIVFLGGAIGLGNISPAAEFNILLDPEAAHIVLESKVQVVMIPIEVSHTCLVDENVLPRIQEIGSVYAKYICELMLFFKHTYMHVFKMPNPPLHDPCAVAYVIDEGLFKSQIVRVDVETASKFCNGRTVCDVYHMSGKPQNCRLCTEIHVSKFWDLIIHAIKKANANSILNK